MSFAHFLPLIVMLFSFQSPVQAAECSDSPGFLPLFGTSKCVKVFDDVERNWYASNIKCYREGLSPVKTSSVNALNIRNSLVKSIGDKSSYGWLDARFNGVQYVWGDGEVIANNDALWYKGDRGIHPVLKPDYCVCLVNSNYFVNNHPSAAYYSTPCTAVTSGRKAFCEVELNNLQRW